MLVGAADLLQRRTGVVSISLKLDAAAADLQAD
jgi:hypothetical protein